jgi:hypothetical protein
MVEAEIDEAAGRLDIGVAESLEELPAAGERRGAEAEGWDLEA